MKYFFSLIFIQNLLFAHLSDIKNLQEEFFETVIKLSNYKKLEEKYLYQKCQNFDIECQKKFINSIVEENQLKRFINYHLSLVYTSPNYLDKLVVKLRDRLDLKSFLKDQFVGSIDLEKQLFILFFYDKRNDKFHKIGSDLISGGDMEKEEFIKFGEDHFFNTPTGVFKIKNGWRSTGEYKYLYGENYLPYGVKDRFIYYIGSISSKRYNTFNKEKQKLENKEDWKIIKDNLEFALHAHNSGANFGQPYSHGCVRMRDELNYFLDINSVFHKPFIKDNKWVSKKGIEAPKIMKYENYAGEYVVIFSSI